MDTSTAGVDAHARRHALDAEQALLGRREDAVAHALMSIAYSLLALAGRLDALRPTLTAAHGLCRDCGVRRATVNGPDGHPVRCRECYVRAGRRAHDTPA